MQVPSELESGIVELLRRVVTGIPSDVRFALESAYSAETNPLAKSQLEALLRNIQLGSQLNAPICQDTGLACFYAKLNRMLDLSSIILSSLRRATAEVPLRPNTVDPIDRSNPGDNTGMGMPMLHLELWNEDHLELGVICKGAGSENMSKFGIFPPRNPIQQLKRFVLETVVEAAGNPCPPIFLGIGVGGSAEYCMQLAKRALLRRVDQRHPNPQLAALESELMQLVNSTGIGAMGLGGDVTCLGVNLELAHTHTASLPIAVNVQCWALRRGLLRVYDDGRMEFLEYLET